MAPCAARTLPGPPADRFPPVLLIPPVPAVPALTLLRRLLLLPLLAPLLAVLLLAALNPRPLVSVRVLTSRSPALPLGVWLAAGGAGGALLSGTATALALRQGRRRLRGRSSTAAQDLREPWFGPGEPFGRGRTGAVGESESRDRPAADWDVRPQAGPERAPGEPPPTVSVPFRVLRRPQRSTGSASGGAAAAPAAAASFASREGGAAGPERQGTDDWDSVAEEDW